MAPVSVRRACVYCNRNRQEVARAGTAICTSGRPKRRRDDVRSASTGRSSEPPSDVPSTPIHWPATLASMGFAGPLIKKRFLEMERRSTRATMLSVTSFISPSSSKTPAGSILRTLSVKGQASRFRKLPKLITAASATVAPIIIRLRPRITVPVSDPAFLVLSMTLRHYCGVRCSWRVMRFHGRFHE